MQSIVSNPAFALIFRKYIDTLEGSTKAELTPLVEFYNEVRNYRVAGNAAELPARAQKLYDIYLKPKARSRDSSLLLSSPSVYE